MRWPDPPEQVTAELLKKKGFKQSRPAEGTKKGSKN
jgi:hypothetical protein